MKHRYSKVKKSFVLSFCVFSLLVASLNIVGVARYGYVGIFNSLLILASFTGSLLTSVYIFFGYKEFDLKNHLKLVKRVKMADTSSLPDVDVFLPCAGESLKVLKRTYQGVNSISYPKDKTHVYVLDDKGDNEIKLLAEKYNFNYLSRPNKGESKKAGNLRYGFEHSTGKYILILDADFSPKKDILFELLPYLEGDDKVGIAQSPQDFILNRNEPIYIQKGDIGVQEFFYRICEVARNTFNASICVGTNAVYRREALEKAGGFYQIEHSEDSHTGVNLIKHGYKISYIPVTLATGYCPSDYYSIFKQRSRWCLGSLSLMRSKLFKEAKFSYMAVMCYLSGFYYYLSSFIVILLPIHTLYLLSTPAKSSITDTLFFLPNIIFLIVSYTNFYYPRFNFAILGNQFFFYCTYMFIIIKEFVFGKKEGWVATGSLQRTNNSYKILISAILIYITFYWSRFISIVLNPNFRFAASDYLLLIWIIYNMLGHISFVTGLVILSLNKVKLGRNKLSLIKVALNN